MNAMILCAGLGTRLRPLTERWPKPAMPFLGQPLFRFNLALLVRAGVKAVGINTHHLPEVMRSVAEAECGRAGVELTCVHEPVIQGTGGGIRGLRALLSGGPSIVINGDILFAVDLRRVVEAHLASRASATMVLMPLPPGEKYAAVECTASGEVRRIAGHGPGGEKLSPWHFTGVHILSPELFDVMSPSGVEDINREVYPRAMQKGLRIQGHVVQGYWSDMGTPSRYLAAQRDVLFGQVPLEAFPDASPFDGAQHPSAHMWTREAKIAGGVAGPALLDRCEVAAGALIGSAVYVAEGCRIAPGARLNRVAVLEHTAVAEGEELVECIACGTQRIPAPLTAV